METMKNHSIQHGQVKEEVNFSSESVTRNLGIFTCTWCPASFVSRLELEAHVDTCQHRMICDSDDDSLPHQFISYQGLNSGTDGVMIAVPHLYDRDDILVSAPRLDDRNDNVIMSTPHMNSVTEYVIVSPNFSTINSPQKSFQTDECNREFKCTECGKGFTTKKYRKMHMRIHSGIKPFKCEECGKCFYRRNDLSRHVTIHTRNQQSKSVEREVQFPSQYINVDHHMEIHNPLETFKNKSDEGFKSDKCNRNFQDKKILQAHMIFHNEESLKSHHVKIHTEEKLSKCAAQGTQFSSQHRHTLSRTGEQTFKCDGCSKVFTDISKLDNHTNGDTGGKQCCTQFPSHEHNDDHYDRVPTPQKSLQSDEHDKEFKCDHCEEAFLTRKHLQMHLRIHSRKESFKCDYCSKAFFNRNQLSTHIKIHTQRKSLKKRGRPKRHIFFRCEECSKVFLTEENLQIHIGEKPFKYDKSGKAYFHYCELHRHTFVRSGEETFKCDGCSMVFTGTSNLDNHTNADTGEKQHFTQFSSHGHNVDNERVPTQQKSSQRDESDKRFKCDQCGKRFPTNKHLRAHMIIHSGEKPFKCGECGKAFLRGCDLKRHAMCHTGEKPFKCDVCQKAFLDRSKLKEHMNTHTGERPYKCNECGEAFAQTKSLWYHKQVHIRLKEKSLKPSEGGTLSRRQSNLNYQMKSLPQQMSSQSNQIGDLKNHVKYRTRKKSFKCDVCHKAFHDNAKLKEHMNTHTGEKPYKCNECGDAFAQTKSLWKHKQVHIREKSS